MGTSPLNEKLQAQLDMLEKQKYYWTTYPNPRDLINEVNRYLVYSCEYDYDAYRNPQTAPSAKIAYSELGILYAQKAVCQGFSEYFQRIVSYAKIPCVVLSGSAGGPHAWNVLYLDNTHYYFDTTFNNGHSSETEYSWRSRAEMDRDHTLSQSDEPYGY